MWLLWGKRVNNTNLGQTWIFSFKSISLKHSYKCLLLYFLFDRKNTLLHHLPFGPTASFLFLKWKGYIYCVCICVHARHGLCVKVRGQLVEVGSLRWQNWSWGLDSCPETCWQNKSNLTGSNGFFYIYPYFKYSLQGNKGIVENFIRHFNGSFNLVNPNSYSPFSRLWRDLGKNQ